MSNKNKRRIESKKEFPLEPERETSLSMYVTTATYLRFMLLTGVAKQVNKIEPQYVFVKNLATKQKKPNF